MTHAIFEIKTEYAEKFENAKLYQICTHCETKVVIPVQNMCHELT